MQLRHVVTGFLRHPDEGSVLLGRRSSDVHTYAGRWAGISGSVETDRPVEQAYREIREETGLERGQVELAAEGLPVRFIDWELKTRWIVHPYLFRCLAPDRVRRDWEHVRFEWTDPERIPELKTVPRLAEAWRAARGAEGREGGDWIFESVRDDRERGAEELGLRTLEGLRRTAEAGDAEATVAACRTAAGLRPSMAPVLSAALEVYSLTDGGEEDLTEGIDELIGRREAGSLRAAENAAERLPEAAGVVTVSYSSTVLAALCEAAEHLERLTVAESRPACEGRRTAETAASFGIEVELVTDAAAVSAARQADAVLFGADSLLADGSVVNKTGTFALCCGAARGGARTLCVATRSKVRPAGHTPEMERMDPSELGEPIDGVAFRNVYFEPVPPDLVGTVAGADGPLSPDDLRARADRLRELRESLTQ